MIFWQYLKGLNEESDGTKPNYTFINFQSRPDQISAVNATEFDRVPTITMFSNNSSIGDNRIDCGHIITQKAQSQSIDKEFWFNADINSKGILKCYNRTNNGFLTQFFNNQIQDAEHKPSELLSFWTPSDSQAELHCNIDLHAPLYLINHKDQGKGLIRITPNATHLNSTTQIVGATTIVGDLIVTNQGAGAREGKCEAVYFNATSDRRAKKDINPFEINALDLIKKVQVYSFKYREGNLPSIGIIAQDVQDIKIGDFDLVDNKSATGENMDYMSIHESKLIYILWKAVQEQQQEIEELKKRLK